MRFEPLYRFAVYLKKHGHLKILSEVFYSLNFELKNIKYKENKSHYS